MIDQQNEDTEPVTRAAEIDRLVTGDLTRAEQSELLQWLDAEPSRWRQCGLAFLEAQAWTRGFSSIALSARPTNERTSPPPSAQRAAAGIAPPKRGVNRSPRRLALHIAGAVAAVLVGVVLGVGGAPWVRKDLRSEPPTAASSDPFAPAPAVDDAVASDQAKVELAQAAHGCPEGFRLVGLLTIQPADRQGDEVQVPVLEGPVSGAWAAAQAEELAGQVQQHLAQQGVRVEQRQQLLPLLLADGRQVIVPVHEFRIQQPDNDSY